MPQYFEIRIMGRLDPLWSEWFSDLEITYPGESETLLEGILPDQAALHSLLERIRDLNMTLISVNCTIPPKSPDQKQEGESNER